MRVRLDQLWEDGKSRDGRERYMAGNTLVGHLFIEQKDSERYALFSQNDGLREERVEALPRLWNPAIVSMRGPEFRLRGVQKQNGRLVHQEWLCYALVQQT
jgi:hypothetical protein